MNQKTQHCVQSDEKPCIRREFTERLYFSTLDLWKHNNDLLLKWPQVIIGGTIIFLVNLFDKSKITDFLFKPESWGDNDFSQKAVGWLLIIVGLAIITMLYVMWRARMVMVKIETKLSYLSGELFKDKNYFENMNHPDGMSGRTLIWFFMAFLAFPMTFLGSCILFGLGKGISYSILFAILFAISFLILFLHDGFIISLFKEWFKSSLIKKVN